ncbi:hypothetical protein MHM98_15550 [Psychrobium sp. MM17-31]|uniref:hypothetical protein n=1 Tax=Psychrobium sp. MM17-31 TaxID=2917758 RepID=UPI001EF71404|nr:hypothetical protein [Psychrobium sp. MM17-31]MCG7532749.1 hypothetical protein [Psychrobium sp. MM17-31]
MTIIAAAIKNGQVAISSDTQVNFGALQVNSKYLVDKTKLFRVGDSVLGFTGWSATCQIMEHLLASEPELFELDSRMTIFSTLLKIQHKLKEEYFIDTSEDSDQPVESNQIDGLVINPTGIYQIGSYREVHQYSQFWSIGSGRRYALGAMHSTYDTATSAQEIAEAGVKAAAEFDDACNLPLHTMVLDLATNQG